MRSSFRLIFLLILARFGCALANPETTLASDGTSEEAKVSESAKLPGGTKNELFSLDVDREPHEPLNSAPEELSSFNEKDSTTEGTEEQDAAKEATSNEGNVLAQVDRESDVDRKAGKPSDDSLGEDASASDVEEATEGKPIEETVKAGVDKSVTAAPNAGSVVEADGGEDPIAEDDETEEEIKVPESLQGGSGPPLNGIEGKATDKEAIPDEGEGSMQANRESDVDRKAGKPSDDSLGEDASASDVEEATEGKPIEETVKAGVDKSVTAAPNAGSVVEADGGEDPIAEDDENYVNAKVTESPHAGLGLIEENKSHDVEEEKEIERKAAEDEEMVDLGEGAIRVDLPPEALLEDSLYDSEAASESAGSLTLPSVVLCYAVHLLLLIY
ncbi:hypothetical protein TcWFU_002573 [Taenia crassiceps]|uniref:Uncharacterized protein n=1 Tax=Taenia crassiceps TaxID=6207 RepID=A0ABR4Q7P4_9CEST